MAFSLNTTDFLNELSQMVATRGKPEEVASNNGKNFAGAERKLRELVPSMDKGKITHDAAIRRIKWSWNPPLGSYFGGVFDSLIKVAKKTMKAMVENAGLDDNELQSAIKKAEALTNSRRFNTKGKSLMTNLL